MPILSPQRTGAGRKTLTVWQCIGCGRIEGPQPCIGICEDRRVDLVHAAEHDEVLSRLALARSQLDALAELVRQLARTTPREGNWESTYRAMQARARALLASLAESG
jgi:hypothetical protein